MSDHANPNCEEKAITLGTWGELLGVCLFNAS